MARTFTNSDFGLARPTLTFNNTRFNLNGIQNKPVFSSLNNLSENSLTQFSKAINKKLNLSEIKTHSNLSKDYEFNNEVSFTDKISSNTINLRLSEKNLQRLKTTFGSQDFDKDKSGRIVLSGEAQDFVAGWFGDIAYKRNYVGADADKNGFLSENEKGATLAGYSADTTYKANGANVEAVDFKGIVSYLPYTKHYDAPIPNTIEKALNATLQADTNMDGHLNLGELQSREEIIKYTKKTIEGEIPSQTNEGEVDLLKEQMKQMKKWLEEQLKKHLDAQNYASTDEYFSALAKEIQGIQKLSVSFKLSEQIIIKNYDKPNFTDDINTLINAIKQNVKDSIRIDISA